MEIPTDEREQHKKLGVSVHNNHSARMQAKKTEKIFLFRRL